MNAVLKQPTAGEIKSSFLWQNCLKPKTCHQ